MEHQRAYERYELAKGKTWLILESDGSRHQLVDISRGGVMFLTDRRFQMGSHLSISMDGLFFTEIEVVRMKEMGDNKIEVGAIFAEGPIGGELISEVLKLHADL